MDREQREQANRALHEVLARKLEANRGGLTLEALMGRSREEEATEPPSNATREPSEAGERES